MRKSCATLSKRSLCSVRGVRPDSSEETYEILRSVSEECIMEVFFCLLKPIVSSRYLLNRMTPPLKPIHALRLSVRRSFFPSCHVHYVECGMQRWRQWLLFLDCVDGWQDSLLRARRLAAPSLFLAVGHCGIDDLVLQKSL